MADMPLTVVQEEIPLSELQRRLLSNLLRNYADYHEKSLWIEPDVSGNYRAHNVTVDSYASQFRSLASRIEEISTAVLTNDDTGLLVEAFDDASWDARLGELDDTPPEVAPVVSAVWRQRLIATALGREEIAALKPDSDARIGVSSSTELEQSRRKEDAVMEDTRKTVVGNLTRDPQVGVDKNGKSYALMRLAENTRVQDEHGNWGDGPTEYHNVYVGGQLGQHVGQTLHKGDQAIVSGYQHEGRSYEKKDGTLAMGDPQIQAVAVGVGLQYNAATVLHKQRSAEQDRLATLMGSEIGIEGPSPTADPAMTTEWPTATPGQPLASPALA